MASAVSNGRPRIPDTLPASLLEGLTLALEAVPPPAAAAALTDADPLRLDLPALPALPATSPEALRALAALYLAARLEDTGLLKVTEWLVQQRAVLRIGPTTARLLEDAARRRPLEVPAEQRVRLYARLFGVGAGVTGHAVGSDARFEPLLAALCSALVACGPRPPGAQPDRDHFAVAHAARSVAAAAGATFGGAAALSVPRIEDQLRRAIALVGDPGIGALVGASGFWPTLRGLLGAGAPDLRRLLDTGRGGQHVLLWLAGAAGELADPVRGAPTVTQAAVTSAAAWLQACGLALPARREGWA